MYTGFGLPPRPGDTGAGADRLSKVRENAYKTTDRGVRRAVTAAAKPTRGTAAPDPNTRPGNT